MYYNTSPHILDFYKDAVDDKTGTYELVHMEHMLVIYTLIKIKMIE